MWPNPGVFLYPSLVSLLLPSVQLCSTLRIAAWRVPSIWMPGWFGLTQIIFLTVSTIPLGRIDFYNPPSAIQHTQMLFRFGLPFNSSLSEPKESPFTGLSVKWAVWMAGKHCSGSGLPHGGLIVSTPQREFKRRTHSKDLPIVRDMEMRVGETRTMKQKTN